MALHEQPVQPGSQWDLDLIPTSCAVEKIIRPDGSTLLFHTYHTPIGVFRFGFGSDASAAFGKALLEASKSIQVAHQMPPSSPWTPPQNGQGSVPGA